MTTDAIGGAWTYALDLAHGLTAFGVRTTLAVLGPPPSDAQRAAAEAVPGLRILPRILPLDWLAKEQAEVEAAGRMLADLAMEIGASLVHLNSPALAAGVRFPVPVVGVCHSCLATWWDAVRGEVPMPEEFRWRTAMLARGYAAVDALLAPSAAFALATARRYGLVAPPAAVHNGRRWQGEMGDADQLPDLAFTAGRLWDEGKNVAALDRVAGQLPMPVAAAGPTEGPNGAGIRLQHLRLLGQLSESDVAAHLRRRPVFVSTALYEPFGLAVLEAAASGCALVLSDIPSFRELWQDAADFVPPRDEAALRASMLRMARDRERRRRFGVAARERARRYSLEGMTRGVLEVYGRVLRGAGMPAGRNAAA